MKYTYIEFATAYQHSHSTQELMAELGCDIKTVRRYCKKLRLPSRWYSKPELLYIVFKEQIATQTRIWKRRIIIGNADVPIHLSKLLRQAQYCPGLSEIMIGWCEDLEWLRIQNYISNWSQAHIQNRIPIALGIIKSIEYYLTFNWGN